MSQAMVSLTTLYQDLFVQYSCHIIDNYMGKWVKQNSMTSAFVKGRNRWPKFLYSSFWSMGFGVEGLKTFVELLVVFRLRG
jgi:hypothetical protein